MSATVQRLNWEGKDAQDRRPHTREDHVRRDLEDDIGHEEKQQADGVLRRGEREVLLHPADLRVPDVRAVEVGERVQYPDGGDLKKIGTCLVDENTVYAFLFIVFVSMDSDVWSMPGAIVAQLIGTLGGMNSHSSTAMMLTLKLNDKAL